MTKFSVLPYIGGMLLLLLSALLYILFSLPLIYQSINISFPSQPHFLSPPYSLLFLYSDPLYLPGPPPATFTCFLPSCPEQPLPISIANPKPQPLHGPAAASLLFDEGWWRCMSGGIDNIYGGEWEWSIFLSGPVTPLAKLHHGQLPRQTPSSLVLLLPGPHLHTDTWTH